jgi:hypothetical protein
MQQVAASLPASLSVALLQHQRFLDLVQARRDELMANYPSNDYPDVAASGAAGVGGNQKESRDASSMTATFRDAAITRELFPGWPQCRPCVEQAEFDKDDACCAKLFVSSKAHSLGLVIVICVGRHQRVIRVHLRPSSCPWSPPYFSNGLQYCPTSIL